MKKRMATLHVDIHPQSVGLRGPPVAVVVQGMCLLDTVFGGRLQEKFLESFELIRSPLAQGLESQNPPRARRPERFSSITNSETAEVDAG